MSQSSPVRVLGISGSLRKGSFNTAALHAAQELLPEGMMLEIADISQIPLYNDDVRQAGYPPPVQTFREQIAAADALLFATPEYNFSVSGVLKNAIDWGSRPLRFSSETMRSLMSERSRPRSPTGPAFIFGGL